MGWKEKQDPVIPWQSSGWGPGSVLGQEINIPQATQAKKKARYNCIPSARASLRLKDVYGMKVKVLQKDSMQTVNKREQEWHYLEKRILS